MDSYYTPPPIAAEMVRSHEIGAPRLIADFAVGNGSLLTPAAKRWPAARIIGTDKDQAAVRVLRRDNPSWLVSTCDFLNPRSRSQSSALVGLAGRVELLLLNPPFSCRGGTRRSASIHGTEFRCSLAAAFLLTGVSYLDPNGTLIALIPAGSPESQKDQAVFEYLSDLGTLDILSTYNRGSFPGCAAKTMLLRLTLRDQSERIHRAEMSPPTYTPSRSKVELVRGVVQMHNLRHIPTHRLGRRHGTLSRFVHTSHLRQGCVSPELHRLTGSVRGVAGPAVLLPRVGRPVMDKIAVLSTRRPVVISDCVIAIKCTSDREAVALRQTLLLYWQRVQSCYVGTGAPFITLRRLEELLRALGYAVVGSTPVGSTGGDNCQQGTITNAVSARSAICA